MENPSQYTTIETMDRDVKHYRAASYRDPMKLEVIKSCVLTAAKSNSGISRKSLENVSDVFFYLTSSILVKPPTNSSST